ncbi:MAG TPA: hypothetical protein VF993_11785, partial [Myxococcales bacterium]
MRGLYRQVLPAEIGQVSPRAKHGIWRRSMAYQEKPMLGAWSAIGAFAALYVGQHSIGIGAQYHSIVSGLWVTEALAIAAPAIFVLLLAGVRPAPYLGFRALTWKHALVAVAVSAANQPVVSFLTWAAHGLLPVSWAN